MIRRKKRLWKAYKRTGKVEDGTKYNDALEETTNEIIESKGVRLATIRNRFTNPVSDSLFDWRNRKPDSETEDLPR